jgi:hypothetical protein
MNPKISLIIFSVFLLFTFALCVINAFAINQVSTDAFEYGKTNNNKSTYKVVGTAYNIRLVNIVFSVLSMLCLMLSIYSVVNLSVIM